MIPHSFTEADQYFKELKQDEPIAKNVFDTITTTINQALAQQDYSMLLKLTPYIEKGEGHFAYKYIGETHRLFRILHIIELEQKYHKLPFSHNCSDYTSLMEKYMLTLFALRRLLFQLSDDSINDAATYLLHSNLSIFAVFTITQDELLIPNDLLYQTLIEIYAEHWKKEDVQLLLSLIRRP